MTGRQCVELVHRFALLISLGHLSGVLLGMALHRLFAMRRSTK